MRLQATIAGFSGQGQTLIGVLDEKSGVLVVAKAIKFREDKAKDDFCLVSNLNLPAVDWQFTDEHLRDAIKGYYQRVAQGLLIIEEPVRRFQPDNRIERDTVDIHGQKYRISPDIDNGQVGILALCYYCNRQDGMNAAMEAANELTDFYTVHSI